MIVVLGHAAFGVTGAAGAGGVAVGVSDEAGGALGVDYGVAVVPDDGVASGPDSDGTVVIVLTDATMVRGGAAGFPSVFARRGDGASAT